MRLYEISGALAQVWARVNDEEFDLDTLEDTIQSLEGELEVQAPELGKMIRMIEADTDTLANEIKRLTERKRLRENRISRLKSYIQNAMEIAGKDKIVTPTMTLTIQKNPPSVDDYDPESIPGTYQKVTYAIDKQRLLADLKAGMEIPGATLKHSRGLRIK